MPVSNAHLDRTTRIWDGLTYRMVPNAEAKRLEKQGLAQRTKNLQAKDLKTAAEFDVARQKIADKQAKAEVSALPPGVTAEPKKRQYKTRQMKADK